MRSDLKSATREGSLIEEGGLTKSQNSIRGGGGLANPKSYKRGVSSNTDRRVVTFNNHLTFGDQ